MSESVKYLQYSSFSLEVEMQENTGCLLSDVHTHRMLQFGMIMLGLQHWIGGQQRDVNFQT